ALWDRNPVEALERLRDRVCDAINLVVEIHRLALKAPAGQTLADVGQERHKQLHRVIVEAQAIWFGTPIARYFDRPDGPAYLDRQKAGATGRVSGSCHHDLGLAVGLWLWTQDAVPAAEYVRAMQFYTAAGNHVPEHLGSLVAEVRCESQQGVARWKAETTSA